MKTVSFYTLGCKVNQYDSDAMRGMFLRRGYKIVPVHEIADIFVINTCSVTHVAERKSRQMIRRFRRMNPESLIIVAGCYAQLSPDIIAQIKGVNIIIGTHERSKIVDLAEKYNPEEGCVSYIQNIMDIDDFEEMRLYGDAVENTRAYVKIQEGCENYCTFCIIPFTRGKLKSRLPEDIYHEAKRLAEQGYKEIVLTGIHLGNYGRDLNGSIDLAAVVQDLLAKTDIERIRLGSIESVELSDNLVEMLTSESRLCPHLHLPLQSGSDRVLKMMNRHYGLKEYYRLIENLRLRIPDLALTTDIIVGFPGENDEMFAETLNTLRELQFSGVHIFPYSKRAGTPAASYPNQVPEQIKKERVRAAEDVARETAMRYRRKSIGKNAAVLVERLLPNGRYEGTTAHYQKVDLIGDGYSCGKIYTTKILDVTEEGLIGKVE